MHPWLLGCLVVAIGLWSNANAQTLLAPHEVIGDSLSFVRLPGSVKAVAGGGKYMDLDSLGVNSNPALLAYQETSFATAVSDRILFADEQNILHAGGSWASGVREDRAYGVGIAVSRLVFPTIYELDSRGDKTGNTVKPDGTTIGGTAMYSWHDLSAGAGLRYVSQNLGAGVARESTLMASLGLGLKVGRFLVGGDFHSSFGDNGPSWLSVGGAFDVPAPMWVRVAAEWALGESYGTGGSVTVGCLVGFKKYGHFRGGVVWQGSEMDGVRFGLSVPIKAATLDYAIIFPLGDAVGLGQSHTVGIAYSFGGVRSRERKRKFFMDEQSRSLAVLDFEAQNVSSGDAAVVTDLFRTDIINTGAFNVIEKGNMQAVLQEQAFQQTGCTTNDCAVKLGKILNVRYLVVGSFGKALGSYLLTIRVVDVETARAVYSDTADGNDIKQVREGIEQLVVRLSEATVK